MEVSSKMQKGQEKLFEPIRIGSAVMPNRIAMAPMGIIGMLPRMLFCRQSRRILRRTGSWRYGLIITGAVRSKTR